jgi:hypothetical protein
MSVIACHLVLNEIVEAVRGGLDNVDQPLIVLEIEPPPLGIPKGVVNTFISPCIVSFALCHSFSFLHPLPYYPCLGFKPSNLNSNTFTFPSLVNYFINNYKLGPSPSKSHNFSP